MKSKFEIQTEINEMSLDRFSELALNFPDNVQDAILWIQHAIFRTDITPDEFAVVFQKLWLDGSEYLIDVLSSSKK
jgi:hypothetical protein